MLIHYPGLSKNPILCPFRKPSNNARNYGYRTLVSYPSYNTFTLFIPIVISIFNKIMIFIDLNGE